MEFTRTDSDFEMTRTRVECSHAAFDAKPRRAIAGHDVRGFTNGDKGVSAASFRDGPTVYMLRAKGPKAREYVDAVAKSIKLAEK
jgi:hypothetical protein